MTVTFQVGDREFGGSGNLDIDFWVRGVQKSLKRVENAIHYGKWLGQAETARTGFSGSRQCGH